MTTIEAMTSGDYEPITNEQILALQREAAEAGDDEQVTLCERALRGNSSARVRCANALYDAQAQDEAVRA